MSSGHMYSESDYLVYFSYYNTASYYSVVGSDGVLSNQGADPHDNIDQQDVMPVFYVDRNRYDQGDELERARMNVVSVVEETQEIPYAFLFRSANLFQNNAVEQFTYCNTASCYTYDDLRTHLPLMTAYDNVSGETIYARVITDPSDDNNGNIVLHVGEHSVVGRLNRGTMLFTQNEDPNTACSLPSCVRLTTTEPYSPYDLWSQEYTTETDFPVGLSCAKNQSIWEYNCLLAWRDRNVPNGRVVYTYFRVNNDGYLEFEGNAWARSGSHTFGGVSVAFFDNKFSMAWKTWDGYPKLAYTQTNGSGYTDWSDVEKITISSGRDIIDIPSWYTNSGLAPREAFLYWFEK